MSYDHHHRIYLGRLPYGTREKDIEKFLQGCGRIRDINLKNGFGFVVSSRCRDGQRFDMFYPVELVLWWKSSNKSPRYVEFLLLRNVKEGLLTIFLF